jgi:TPR repeat protein
MGLSLYEGRLKSFPFFERAAAKGHEESIWILSVWKDVEMKYGVLMEAFVKTAEPLGWWFAGRLSEDERERFDFFKKSAEAGCSWAQVSYGGYFRRGEFVEQDNKVYVEWLERAANQNSPDAMHLLGKWFRNDGDDKEKAVMYYGAAAELGWKVSMNSLAQMLRDGEGCAKDLRQVAIWGAKANLYIFWDVFAIAGRALGTEELDCDFDQLCYALGWGLYWYEYGSGRWEYQKNKNKLFDNYCLDYFCSCVEFQRESIFTFLLYWNRVVGVKDVGAMIGKMVWEGREENLVKSFEESSE